MKKVLFLVAVIIVFVSCSSDDDNDRRELNANRQLWQSHQIRTYKWNERLSCFCAPPLERDIFVIDDVKNRVEFDESGIPPENIEEFREHIFNNAKTIEEAFEFIESLLSQDVASLFIEYDKTYGFPTSIGVDYDKNAIDDEIGYSYSNFSNQN